jgi:hypothetical protein
MTPAARSMLAFGIYATTTGASFIIAPTLAVSMLQLAPISPGWMRTVGLLAMVIGVNDIVMARAESLAFLRLSVPLRYGFATGVFALVATGQMSTMTFLFGLFDAIGATWTLVALRKAVPG